MKDILFLSGIFFDSDIPKEKNFLFKYFKTPLEECFVRYYFCFENYESFSDHTGYYCQNRWLKILKKRLDKLLSEHNQAKKQFDFEMVKKIESGEYKIKNL